MADQVAEKPEVEAPATDAQEAPATEKTVEPSSNGDDTAKADGEANKEETKAAEGKSCSRYTWHLSRIWPHCSSNRALISRVHHGTGAFFPSSDSC